MESGSDLSMAGRCVVWHRVGVDAPASLLRALGSRGLRVETSGSGHEVLAMACREQRRGDVGDGGPRRGLIVVLDGGGDELQGQGRVLEGMERFSPGALVWVYEEGANPPIRAFVGGKAYASNAPIVAEVPRVSSSPKVNGAVGGSAGGPGLRLSGSQGSVNGNGALRSSDILDQDELAALLKPEDD